MTRVIINECDKALFPNYVLSARWPSNVTVSWKTVWKICMIGMDKKSVGVLQVSKFRIEKHLYF